jgi:mRNA degradation ribonuclease J1/J2
MTAKKQSSRSKQAPAADNDRHSRARSPSKSSANPTAMTGARARIRVYRHGLGDCILVRLRRRVGPDYKILIDCGVAMATKKAPDKMTAVVKDVIRETDGKIDVLAVTHEHWDHVSGFTQAEEAFKGLTVGEVWVAWTEDDSDPLAKSLRKDHADALAVLQACANRMAAAGQNDRAAEISNILGLSGAAGDKTRIAFNKAKALGRAQPKIRYWQPDDKQHARRQQTAPIHLEDPGVTIYALGPPYDPKLIRKTLQSKRDRKHTN